LRRQLLEALLRYGDLSTIDLPRSTLSYLTEDLHLQGILDDSKRRFSAYANEMLDKAGIRTGGEPDDDDIAA
jgi:hypothetical protein